MKIDFLFDLYILRNKFVFILSLLTAQHTYVYEFSLCQFFNMCDDYVLVKRLTMFGYENNLHTVRHCLLDI